MRLIFPNGDHGLLDLENGVYALGSAPGNQIVLSAPTILPQHAEIQFNHGNAVLAPAVADANVLINNQRVSRSTEFKPGDLLQLGDVRIRVVAIDKAAAGASAVPINVKRHDDDDGRTKIRTALPKFMLRGVSGGTFGKVFPLTGVTVIGRAPECDISIPTDEISRRHAELRVSQDGVMVEDLGSANGTYVNDRRVTRELLKHGDELRFDQLRFQLVAPGKEMLQGHQAPHAPAPHAHASAAAPAAAASAGLAPWVWVVLIVVALVLLFVAARFAGVI
jgi:pSer/pThr/pTyr-binding forkhead associated (FHA) protein